VSDPLPPTPLIDLEITRRITVITSRAVLLFGVAGAIVFPLVAPDRVGRVFVCVLLAAFATLCLVLVQRGSVKLSSKILALSILTGISLGGIFNGGIEAPVIASCITLVSFCTLVFGLGNALAYTAACSIIFTLLIAFVEPVVPPGKLRAMVNIVLALVNALILWETTRILRGSAEEARAEAKRRAGTEAALRESEERFRRLADNAPDVIFRYRFDTLPIRCEYINAAIEPILGYRPEEYYTDPNLLSNVIHPDDQPLFLALLEQGKPPTGIVAMRWIARDGSVVMTEQRIVPIHDANGRLIAIEGIARDVTAARAESARLGVLEKQLYQAQKVDGIGTLASGIAHDFNNILTGIMGYNELASVSLPPATPTQNYLEEVRKAGLRARDLVAQILKFSRRHEARRITIDLATAVADTLRFLRSTTPATINFVTHLKPGIIEADETQIHQVVLNLCTNAVQSMSDRIGTLSISIEKVAVDQALANTTKPRLVPGDHLCLSIKDTGRGMDEATANRVFEAFFTTKNVGESTGLGLAVVLGIVTSHHGGITFETAPEAGTTFHVYWPVQTTKVPTLPARLTQPRRGGGEKVLIIDDEKSVGTFSALRLEQLGHRVMIFNDPQLALAEIRANPGKIDALITDLTMPGLTGFDLITELHTFAPNMPSVLVTGNLNAISPVKLAELPLVVVVEKPFTGDELAHALRKALDMGQAPKIPA